MLATPSALQSKYEEHLRNMAIPNNLQGMYQKWPRYYLDFCQKYHAPPKHEKCLPPFIQPAISSGTRHVQTYGKRSPATLRSLTHLSSGSLSSSQSC